MRIRMLKTENGAHDGVHVNTYVKGEEYAVGEHLLSLDLAEAFIDMGAAEEVANKPKDKKHPTEPEEVAEKPIKDKKQPTQPSETK